MKKYAIVSLIVGISSNIYASENNNNINIQQNRSKTSRSDGKLLIPDNKQSRPSIINSLEMQRSPQVQNRLNCFNEHQKSKHDQEFIKNVTNPKCENYEIYKELIANCQFCLAVYKQFFENSSN